MKPSDYITAQVKAANRDAEAAYWWMKDINPEEAQRLGITAMVQQVLDLLLKVDNITIDIQIKVKQQTQK